MCAEGAGRPRGRSPVVKLPSARSLPKGAPTRSQVSGLPGGRPLPGPPLPRGPLTPHPKSRTASSPGPRSGQACLRLHLLPSPTGLLRLLHTQLPPPAGSPRGRPSRRPAPQQQLPGRRPAPRGAEPALRGEWGTQGAKHRRTAPKGGARAPPPPQAAPPHPTLPLGTSYRIKHKL